MSGTKTLKQTFEWSLKGTEDFSPTSVPSKVHYFDEFIWRKYGADRVFVFAKLSKDTATEDILDQVKVTQHGGKSVAVQALKLYNNEANQEWLNRYHPGFVMWRAQWQADEKNQTSTQYFTIEVPDPHEEKRYNDMLQETNWINFINAPRPEDIIHDDDEDSEYNDDDSVDDDDDSEDDDDDDNKGKTKPEDEKKDEDKEDEGTEPVAEEDDDNDEDDDNEEIEDKKQASCVSPALIAEFLRFAYTSGNKELEMKIAGMLIQPKDYKVSGLIRICEEGMVNAVNPENTLEFYKLCRDQLNSQKVEGRCLEIMRENKAKIWKTEKDFIQACNEETTMMFNVLINDN